ncbi:MAG TPA: helix-turn-helix domain-containing protein [Archangium sp.]
MLSLVDEALREGVRLEAACSRLGVSPRTVQRWSKPETVVDSIRPAMTCWGAWPG